MKQLNQGSATDDLARSALKVTGFHQLGRTFIRSRLSTPLMICGDSTTKEAKSDVAVCHMSRLILLLVQGDKTPFNDSGDPEPQMVAGVIAAFQHNNRIRVNCGLPELTSLTIPCMTMVGTQPQFYLAQVTSALSSAVAFGRYPPQATVITSCRPPHFPIPCHQVGMEHVDYRRIALQYYVTFLERAEECWQEITADFCM
jgi:hypothetical protein